MPSVLHAFTARRRLAIAPGAFLALALAACGDNSPVKPPLPPAPPGPESLTKREHVLARLEQLYAARDTSGYADLLDTGQYEFAFTRRTGHGPVAATMNRGADLLATWTMFTLKNDPYEIVSFDIRLQWQSAQWQELPPDTAAGRLESWWKTTVPYSFVAVTTGEITLVSFGLPHAEFTVRKGADGKWRMVNWTDLGTGGGLLRVNAASGAVAEMDWGILKDFYLTKGISSGGKGP